MRRKQNRRSSSRNSLFISIRKPAKPVKPATIGHWLKNCMKEAGTNTSVYTAHSAQGAATSKAKAVGVPMADILKAANWNSASTFCQFYNRSSSTSQFGQAVLSNKQITGELQTIPCSKLTMLLECIRILRSTITDSLRIANPIWGG